MSDDLVKILDGNTFVVSDANGDIEASLTDPTGLFSFDTRFLSRWVLTINGERLNALSVDDLQYFETRFFLVPGTGTVYIDAKLSVIRRRAVGDGFHEELTILNHDEKPVDLTVRVEAGSRLRRPVRGQGRAEEEGHVLDPRRRRQARARLRARDVPAGDGDLGVDARKVDEEGPDLPGADRAARQMDDGARRRHRARPAGTHVQPRTREEHAGRRVWSEPRALARRRAAPRVRQRLRSRRPTSAASSTSRRSASRRRSPAGTACRPPACRGS